VHPLRPDEDVFGRASAPARRDGRVVRLDVDVQDAGGTVGGSRVGSVRPLLLERDAQGSLVPGRDVRERLHRRPAAADPKQGIRGGDLLEKLAPALVFMLDL
jgi:hypothetical protein